MKKFKRVYLEITSVCNLACYFCPPTLRPKQFISVEDFSKRLDQIKPHTNFIHLHVKGEPLLHPKIGELLDISHEKGFNVHITTNGTLINKKRNDLLNKPALRQINFSLHSYDGNPALKQKKDKEEYVRSILSFVKEATEKTKLYISLRLWNLSPDNKTNLERERNRELLAIIEDEFNLNYKIEEVKPEGGIKIAERGYILTKITSLNGLH